MKTHPPVRSQSRSLAAILERAPRLQKQVVDHFYDRIEDAAAVLDAATDTAGRFPRTLLALEKSRRERIETAYLPARAAIRDAQVALHLLTLGYLPSSMAMLRQAAEELCLAHLVKHEPSVLLIGRRIALGAASRALHRRHDLGRDQEVCDRLSALIDRLDSALTEDRRPVFFGPQYDTRSLPGIYAQVENIRQVGVQIGTFLKDLLLVETAR
jgi:hypothetical protein